MVSFVPKRYTRGESGTESLVVCLSEYLPLRTVYILGIKVEGFISRRDHESPFVSSRYCLGLRVVCEVSGVGSMKSIDMYILHDSILVVSFSKISAYFA